MNTSQYLREAFDHLTGQFRRLFTPQRLSEVRFYRRLGWEAFLREDFDLAVKAYQEAMNVASDHTDLMVLSGHVYFHWDNLEEARRCYDTACQKPSAKPDYHLYLANTYLKQQQYDKAIAEYRLVKDADLARDSKTEILDQLATAYVERRGADDLSEAKRACLEAEILAPDNAVVVHDSGVVYFFQALDQETSNHDPSRAVKLLNRASERFTRALELATQATGRPDRSSNLVVRIRNSQATAYYHLSRLQPDEANEYRAQALSEIQKAFESKPEPEQAAELHSLTGGIYDAQGETKALNEHEKAVALAPDNPVYRGNLGYAYYKRTNYEKAILEYTKAVNLERKPGRETANYHNMLGVAYASSGKTEQAICEYEAAVNLDPDDAVFHANLAGAYDQLKRYEDAVEQYQKASDLDAGNDDYRNSLGNAYYNLKNYQQAIPQYRQAINITPRKAVYHYNLAKAYHQQKMYKEAVHAYQSAIDTESDKPDYHVGLGHTYLELNQPQDAADEYRKAVQLDSTKADYHYYLGLAYRRLGQFSEAETEYREALRFTPKHVSAHRSLGLLYHAIGRYTDAITELQAALQQSPDDVDVLLALGLSNIEANKAEEGMSQLERTNQLAPEDWRTYYVLGRTYNRLKNFERAAEALQQALQQSREHPDPDIQAQLDEAYINLVKTYSLRGRYADALKLAGKVKGDTINNKEYQELLNEVRAAKDWADHVEADPDNPEPHAQLAGIASRLGQKDKAISEYRKAVTIDPKNPLYRKWLGNQYYKRNDLKAAVEEWEKVLELDPFDMMTTSNLGTAYDGLGPDYLDKALALYEKAAASPSANFVPFYNVGSANYRLRRFDEALAAYQKAADLNKQFAPSYYSIGNCYFRLDQLQDAMAAWQRAIQLNPQFAEGLYNLGIGYWQRGERDQAIRAWRDALQANPNLHASQESLRIVEEGRSPALQIIDLLNSN